MWAHLAALVLQIAGTPGGEGRWWWLFTEADRVYFLDGATILEGDGQREFWYQSIFKAPSNGIHSNLVRLHVDCIAKQSKILNFIAYGKNGEVIARKETPDAPYISVAPDSVGESLLLYGCSSVEQLNKLNATPVDRDIFKAAADIFILMKLGLDEQQAGLMASVNAAKHPDWIEKAIRTFFPVEMQERVRAMYGLPPRGPGA